MSVEQLHVHDHTEISSSALLEAVAVDDAHAHAEHERAEHDHDGVQKFSLLERAKARFIGSNLVLQQSAEISAACCGGACRSCGPTMVLAAVAALLPSRRRKH